MTHIIYIKDSARAENISLLGLHWFYMLVSLVEYVAVTELPSAFLLPSHTTPAAHSEAP